ncbi:MAG TPA: hypothetical protein VH280_21440 [Verrucomicrobiae bacterium]|nr:hypothetical protein [Verrucomicrobiae bacterium]
MTIKTGYLAELQNAIRFRCRCDAAHQQTVLVHETTDQNETVWFGDVELFALIGCKESDKCYAWQSLEDRIRIVTVLHSRLVDSAHRAVQAAVFSGIQPPMFALANDPAFFKRRVERTKKAIHDVHLKPEDLEAIIETVRQTAASVSQKRR